MQCNLKRLKLWFSYWLAVPIRYRFHFAKLSLRFFLKKNSGFCQCSLRLFGRGKELRTNLEHASRKGTLEKTGLEGSGKCLYKLWESGKESLPVSMGFYQFLPCYLSELQFYRLNLGLNSRPMLHDSSSRRFISDHIPYN